MSSCSIPCDAEFLLPMVQTARTNYLAWRTLKLEQEKARISAYKQGEAKRINWWRKWIFLRPYTEHDVCSNYINWYWYSHSETTEEWYMLNDIEEACKISDKICITLKAYKMIKKFQAVQTD